VYFGSSILALDPWHILIVRPLISSVPLRLTLYQSFIPYILLSPTYFNILNVYAFANLDDISWGTKGDTAVANDLGSVTQNIHQQVDVEVYTGPAGANEVYEAALENLRAKKFDTRPKEVEPVRSTAEKETAAKD
jgi:chitin synthase